MLGNYEIRDSPGFFVATYAFLVEVAYFQKRFVYPPLLLGYFLLFLLSWIVFSWGPSGSV